MERYICIHGHFYQPPRENPCLEAVEMQDSAYPYHDWNERIAVECYGPNGAARIVDGQRRITHIVNTYARISYDFGPTLLAWMEHAAPDIYQLVLEADRESQQRFSGHGSALAQAYNHVILPLANSRDKRTQIIWGKRDFERRFRRSPEGMWLPETAVDLETLDIMVQHGMRFAILAQHQAHRVRPLGKEAEAWQDVTRGSIDPTMPYELKLPSGRSIALFFYNGPISRAVAFEGLLERGENLAERLVGAFREEHDGPQLVHVATDGETYGHHHAYGDMALAYALHHIESQGLARLTNYGEYLERFPPTHEVEIYENTSWSCPHGIERWRSNCGCNSGGYPSWTQEWRGPLREAIDWLRDSVAPRYEESAQPLLADPWQARDDYIEVVLDRSPENVERFLAQHAARELSEEDAIRVLKLLELQRHAMLMYTSCGWFFDEISGIETVQVIQYAGRVLQLAGEVLDETLEQPFLERLERARSNIPEHGDGRRIYEKWVRPSLITLPQVGAHYAVSSLFEEYGPQTQVYCYKVDREDYRLFSAGRIRLALGRANITSAITRESMPISFGVLHLGDHNLSGGVREYGDQETYDALVSSLGEAFDHADLPHAFRTLDSHFGSDTYSLRLLFRDEQRKILRTVLDTTLDEAEGLYRQVYEQHTPTMRLLADLSVPPPRAWHAAAEVVINARLRRALSGEEVSAADVSSLLDEAKRWNVAVDEPGLAYELRQTLERLSEDLCREPLNLERLRRLEAAVDAVHVLPFPVGLWRVQNDYYKMAERGSRALGEWSAQGAGSTQAWLGSFVSLGRKLGFEVAGMRENRIGRALEVFSSAEGVETHRHVPRATYRLQFNRAFTLGNARSLVSYLHDLGISDCYTSPLLKAGPGSDHGYDVCDHSQINPLLGGQEEFDALASEVRRRGMGLILDTVPNHMSISGSDNAWWLDVLENGPSSIYASYFDIDWHPVKPELQNKVLLPILGEQYGKALESGQFRLKYEDGSFFIQHSEARLPLAPETYGAILSHQLESVKGALGQEHEHVLELESILTALSYLPGQTELAPERVEERRREKEVIKRRIAALYEASAYVRAAIDTSIEAFNGKVGDPRSFDRLDELLRAQAFRPAFWRVAAEEINYRRFFDVNELAAIRVELPEVFEAAHSLFLRLLAESKATGLRVDHPDGLWDPHRYFRRLQESYLQHCIRRELGEESDQQELESVVLAWFADRYDRETSRPRIWPLYVVAEKVLNQGEALPVEWAVDGTTGYDFLSAVNGLFVHAGNRAAFDRIYGQFIGRDIDYPTLVNTSKKTIMLVSLSSEVNALAHQLERIAEQNRLYRDFTLNGLTLAIREVIAALPVYRTYIDGSESVGRQGQAYVEAAIAEAKRRNRPTAPAIFDFIGDTLLLRNLQDFPVEDQQTLIDWVMKFQQVTGPAMAKGVEDTAFYVYNRLISLNEVGSDPNCFGISVADFHGQNQERRQRWPHSMLATSTHDSKRSEDVRARINVLSEMPQEWATAVITWSELNAHAKTSVGGQPAPGRNDEYLLYQTLVGAWPEGPLTAKELAAFRERIGSYMDKASKEAKVHTSWINPNEQYDAAVQSFVQHLLAEGENPFLESFLPFQRRVAYYGRLNSLAQVLLKLTSPGVPDFYQGTELWDHSLVDPDNRRPVDYKLRRSLLGQLRERIAAEGEDLTDLARELLGSSADGRIKLYLTFRSLGFRQEHSRLFADGAYVPLAGEGDRREHVCAFARTLEGEEALVAVPRLVVGLTEKMEKLPLGAEVWKDTELVLPADRAGARYRNLFTGEVVSAEEKGGMAAVSLAAVFTSFPVALLERIG